MANNQVTKAQLEQQISAQNAQIEKLLAEISRLKTSTPNQVGVSPSKKKSVKIVNMTVGSFVIQGTRMYRLEKQFDSRTFSEQEAKIIVNNMPNAVSNGLLYVIADDEFMEDCELNYDDILDADALKTLLDNNSDAVVAAYQNACDAQKEIIVKMIEDKCLNGGRVDANILVEIGKLCNKDFLSIEAMGE